MIFQTEHLAYHMYGSKYAYQKFCEKYLILQDHMAKMPRPGLQTVESNDARSEPPSVASKPTYICVHCSMVCTSDTTDAHMEDLNHPLCEYSDTKNFFSPPRFWFLG